VPSTLAQSGPVACIAVKPVGKPDAGNRHVRFDERGWETGRWPKAPKLPRPSSTLPHVWSGRALQEDFAELAVSGLASMYPAFDWSCFAPGHHGYQRACVLISGQASTGHLGHQCAHALGRPNLHLVSSSRRPRLETVDWVTSSLAPQFLCSSQGPFLRPGPQSVDRVARRGGQGRPSRLACGWLRRCQAAP